MAIPSNTTEASALGKHLTTYSMSGGSTIGMIFVIVCLIGMGVALIVGGIATLGSGDTTTAIVLFILGLLLGLAPGLALARWFWRARQRKVELYSGGLVYTDPKGHMAVRWEDINAVYQAITRNRVNGVTTSTTYHYTVTTISGQRISLGTGLKDIQSLGERIQRKVFEILMPQMLARFQAGETLNFGKLTLSQAGIGNGAAIVPWNEVKGVKLNNGVITVNRQGKWLSWASITVAQTPNVFIFLALVDQIVGIKTR